MFDKVIPENFLWQVYEVDIPLFFAVLKSQNKQLKTPRWQMNPFRQRSIFIELPEDLPFLLRHLES